MEQVILVDEQDRAIGSEEKLSAHLAGKLHRAISVFIFNKRGELLLQQRAFSKYHSGGLWSNTSCGHPRPGETPLEAASRRLYEEMGIRAPLKKILEFTYRVELDNQITEHEIDHVFIGEFDADFQVNPAEVSAWKWMQLEALQKDILDNSDSYTFWFKLLLPQVLKN